MKKILIIMITLLGFSLLKADAQYVRTRPGVSVNRLLERRDPLRIGPEWQYRRGR